MNLVNIKIEKCITLEGNEPEIIRLPIIISINADPSVSSKTRIVEKMLYFIILKHE